MLNYCFTTKHLLGELKQIGEAFFTEHSLQRHLIVALTMILIGKINLVGENRATSNQANIFSLGSSLQRRKKKSLHFFSMLKSRERHSHTGPKHLHKHYAKSVGVAFSSTVA